MKEAMIWGWGDEPELAGKNAERYISKRWKATMTECSITITGRITEEDVLFRITAYISGKPKGVKNLVDNMFDASLTGKGKVYSITVGFYDYVASDEEKYRDSLPSVKESCKNRMQILMQRFKKHPRVKALLGKENSLVVIPVTTLLCELESGQADKVIVKAGNYNLEDILKVLHLLTDKLIERKVATRILGYSLRDDMEKLEINDLYVEKGKVYLWLGHPAVKH
ncbi:MAG: hypothetical protein FGF48_05605 [Candidatus Brockarchaeota archaeon]|nr:hypothetical protein [Candidatus Brockarchaeota archaeon]